MTITDAPTGAVDLDADHVRALKDADDHVTFFLHGDERYARAVRKTRTNRHASPQYSEVLVPVDTVVKDYRRDNLTPRQRAEAGELTPIRFCVWPISTPKFDHRWRTAVEFIRAGDRLTAIWTVANNTGKLTDAGLVADEFDLQVTRNGKHRLFMLGYQIDSPRSPLRIARSFE